MRVIMESLSIANIVLYVAYAFLPATAIYLLTKLPAFIERVQVWQKYFASHSQFYREAGEGKYKLMRDPFSVPRTYWLCHYAAVQKAFSTTSKNQVDHRAGFDWFHYAGWEIPTTHPEYRDTIRKADQTVHVSLIRNKLSKVLSKVEQIGWSEIDRMRKAIGTDGKIVSLHSLMYRIAYNVNCIALFGEDLDHVATRKMLQRYTENSNHMMNTFAWPLPLWISSRVVPGARRCVKARDDLYRALVDWDKKGGAQNSSNEMRAIFGVFDEAGTSVEVRSTFTNMMMVAFLANTPEVLGWFFMNLVQAPELFQVVQMECDALGDDSIIETDFKKRAPHFYSALFETCRCYVFTGTAAIVTKECTLPGMGGHVFKPGDSIRSLGSVSAMDTEVYGHDAAYWKGHRFVGEGESLLKYDLTFGVGRAPCPGRAFAIAELCMIAVNVIRSFDFSDWSTSKHLDYEADDFEVHGPAPPQQAEIIDLDGSIKRIIHPGNMSDYGPPGMTSSNIPLNEFACRLSHRST